MVVWCGVFGYAAEYRYLPSQRRQSAKLEPEYQDLVPAATECVEDTT